MITAVTQKKGIITSRIDSSLGCGPNEEDDHVCRNEPKQKDENDSGTHEK